MHTTVYEKVQNSLRVDMPRNLDMLLMSLFDAAHATTGSAMSNLRPALGQVEGLVRPIRSSL